MQIRRSVRVAFALALALAAAPAPGETLYRFVDERGVLHFTDAPTDPRYKPFVPKLRPSSTIWRGPVIGFRRAREVRHFDRLIDGIASAHGLPPALVKAVIATESNFDPRAVSAKGAQGLMQLMPTTADMLGVEDPMAPAENVSAGTRYLRALIDRYGRLGHALAAYNAGPQNVDRYGGVPPFPETQQYVQRVLAYYRAYHGDFRP